MSAVEAQAERARVEALEQLKSKSGLRDKTRRNVDKLDEACSQIHKSRGELTVSNVGRSVAELYPGDHPACQSIRNKTPSGESYREVIAIWRTYQVALASTKKTAASSAPLDDLPDIILNQVQPAGIRPVILAMRTALRNMRSQMHIIRAMDATRLVRHEGSVAAEDTVARVLLSEEEATILATFVDVAETASRGLEWDDLGCLVNTDKERLSRPGLLQVLEKILKSCEKRADNASEPTTVRRKRR